MARTSASETFTLIYEKYYGDVLAYCARRVGHHDADDATSRVFELLWRRIDEIPEDILLPWLYGVARRELAHTWRGYGRWQRLLEKVSTRGDVPFDSTADLVVRRDQDLLVTAAVAQMAAADQEILRLSGWEDLTASECAQVLGCSVAAAEQRLHRAKKRLARRLESELARSTSASTRLAGHGGER